MDFSSSSESDLDSPPGTGNIRQDIGEEVSKYKREKTLPNITIPLSFGKTMRNDFPTCQGNVNKLLFLSDKLKSKE